MVKGLGISFSFSSSGNTWSLAFKISNDNGDKVFSCKNSYIFIFYIAFYTFYIKFYSLDVNFSCKISYIFIFYIAFYTFYTFYTFYIKFYSLDVNFS